MPDETKGDGKSSRRRRQSSKKSHRTSKSQHSSRSSRSNRDQAHHRAKSQTTQMSEEMQVSLVQERQKELDDARRSIAEPCLFLTERLSAFYQAVHEGRAGNLSDVFRHLASERHSPHPEFNRGLAPVFMIQKNLDLLFPQVFFSYFSTNFDKSPIKNYHNRFFIAHMTQVLNKVRVAFFETLLNQESAYAKNHTIDETIAHWSRLYRFFCLKKFHIELLKELITSDIPPIMEAHIIELTQLMQLSNAGETVSYPEIVEADKADFEEAKQRFLQENYTVTTIINDLSSSKLLKKDLMSRYEDRLKDLWMRALSPFAEAQKVQRLEAEAQKAQRSEAGVCASSVSASASSSAFSNPGVQLEGIKDICINDDNMLPCFQSTGMLMHTREIFFIRRTWWDDFIVKYPDGHQDLFAYLTNTASPVALAKFRIRLHEHLGKTFKALKPTADHIVAKHIKSLEEVTTPSSSLNVERAELNYTSVESQVVEDPSSTDESLIIGSQTKASPALQSASSSSVAPRRVSAPVQHAASLPVLPMTSLSKSAPSLSSTSLMQSWIPHLQLSNLSPVSRPRYALALSADGMRKLLVRAEAPALESSTLLSPRLFMPRQHLYSFTELLKLCRHAWCSRSGIQSRIQEEQLEVSLKCFFAARGCEMNADPYFDVTVSSEVFVQTLFVELSHHLMMASTALFSAVWPDYRDIIAQTSPTTACTSSSTNTSAIPASAPPSPRGVHASHFHVQPLSLAEIASDPGNDLLESPISEDDTQKGRSPKAHR